MISSPRDRMKTFDAKRLVMALVAAGLCAAAGAASAAGSARPVRSRQASALLWATGLKALVSQVRPERRGEILSLLTGTREPAGRLDDAVFASRIDEYAGRAADQALAAKGSNLDGVFEIHNRLAGLIKDRRESFSLSPAELSRAHNELVGLALELAPAPRGARLADAIATLRAALPAFDLPDATPAMSAAASAARTTPAPRLSRLLAYSAPQAREPGGIAPGPSGQNLPKPSEPNAPADRKELRELIAELGENVEWLQKSGFVGFMGLLIASIALMQAAWLTAAITGLSGMGAALNAFRQADQAETSLASLQSKTAGLLSGAVDGPGPEPFGRAAVIRRVRAALAALEAPLAKLSASVKQVSLFLVFMLLPASLFSDGRAWPVLTLVFIYYGLKAFVILLGVPSSMTEAAEPLKELTKEGERL